MVTRSFDPLWPCLWHVPRERERGRRGTARAMHVGERVQYVRGKRVQRVLCGYRYRRGAKALTFFGVYIRTATSQRKIKWI
jgi:hypothetical protein